MVMRIIAPARAPTQAPITVLMEMSLLVLAEESEAEAAALSVEEAASVLGVDEGVIWAFWRKTCSRGILVGVNMERG